MAVDTQALGDAWRRCEAALPEQWEIKSVTRLTDVAWHVIAMGPKPEGPATCECCGQARHDQWPMVTATARTPTEALNALAERLEVWPGTELLVANT